MSNSQSSSSSALRNVLEQHAASLAGVELRQVDETGKRFVALVPAVRIGKRASKRQASFRTLQRIADQCLRDLDLKIDWVIVGNDLESKVHQAFDSAIRARFPDLIENVVVSSASREPVVVWLEIRRSLFHGSIVKLLEKFASHLLQLLEFPKAEIVIGGTRDFPSKAVLLRLIKTHSPTFPSLVLLELRKAEFEVEAGWLDSRLDSLRRQGLLVRSANGEVSLSDKGSRVVPHGDYRSSSDIERVLALARRRW
jgi:hypothetical protein